MIVPVDLATVDPKGRIDVLAYKGIEWYVKQLEAKNGIVIWDAIKPHVNKIVLNTVTGITIPPEVQIILAVIQANMQKKVGP
jgi:hypothetical protein